MYNLIQTLLMRIQLQKPVILNLTNTVTQDFIANGLLAIGASPIMTSAAEEIDELVVIASSVVINIGTLNPAFNALSTRACRKAHSLNKPLVLDPVGAGASLYRTQTCMDWLKQFKFTCIRGNASEIMALSNACTNTQGVDASITTLDALDGAQRLSTQHKLVTVVSGATDAIVQSSRLHTFERGSDLMPRVTGSGCLLSAVVGAFIAVHDDAYEAASAAALFYSVCGERAAKKTQSPGSFKVHFLDALSLLPESHDYEIN